MFFTISSLFIIFITIIISQFLIEPELQPIFWMIAFLLFICYANIYASVQFYINLRNNPGLQGEMGNPGDRGNKGSDGVCVINTGCDALQNCDELIENSIREYVSEYDTIRKKEEKGIVLSKAENNIISNINGYKEILRNQCNTLPYSREEFKKIIEESFKD